MDAKSIESGKTNGTIVGKAYNRNFNIRKKSRSLPAKSAINNQTVCNIKINSRIIKTVPNVVKKVFKRYLSRIFTLKLV